MQPRRKIRIIYNPKTIYNTLHEKQMCNAKYANNISCHIFEIKKKNHTDFGTIKHRNKNLKNHNLNKLKTRIK